MTIILNSRTNEKETILYDYNNAKTVSSVFTDPEPCVEP